MRLLLLNTCGAEGMVALASGEGVVASAALPGRGSSEELMPAMRGVFTDAGWTAKQLDAVAVVHGPGSFTGVRVGLSAAKGLCDALDLPMVALSRLALLAAGSDAEEVVVLLDAGRGEFYCGVYRGSICLREELLTKTQVLAIVHEYMAVTCEPRVAEALQGVAVELVDEPGAELVLRLALERIAAGEWADVATIDANYLRRTDAELLVERRSAEGAA